MESGFLSSKTKIVMTMANTASVKAINRSFPKRSPSTVMRNLRGILKSLELIRLL